MINRVDHVRTDISEERSASIIRVIRIIELKTTLAVTIDQSTQVSKKYKALKFTDISKVYMVKSGYTYILNSRWWISREITEESGINICVLEITYSKMTFLNVTY
jgi:hypothetical protein